LSFLTISEFSLSGEELIACFAEQLRFFDTVIVVKILMRRVAVRTADMSRRRRFMVNRLKLFASFREILLKQKFVVFGYGFFLNLAGCSVNGGVESTMNFL